MHVLRESIVAALFCVVDAACHCVLNWPLQMCTCNCIEQVQATAPPTQPATINRPAQLPKPLQYTSAGCAPLGAAGGPGAKRGAGPDGCTAQTAFPGL